MTTSALLRDRYRSDAVETMSPGRLIVALYDRLVLDLTRAVTAIDENDLTGAHGALLHAQDIVSELHDSLDVSKWAAGAQLAAVYEFVLRELVACNVAKDSARVASCAGIIRPLRDAWREAAGIAP
jgi:flagellar protein FliS